VSARHTTRSHNRLMLTATALVATAALLRLMSPDDDADAAPKPSHSTSPTRSTTHHTTSGTPIPRPTHWTPTTPQQPPALLPPSDRTAPGS
jgi:hypothetical protein